MITNMDQLLSYTLINLGKCNPEIRKIVSMNKDELFEEAKQLQVPLSILCRFLMYFISTRYKFNLSYFIYLLYKIWLCPESIATMKNHFKRFLRFYNFHLWVGLTLIYYNNKYKELVNTFFIFDVNFFHVYIPPLLTYCSSIQQSPYSLLLPVRPAWNWMINTSCNHFHYLKMHAQL